MSLQLAITVNQDCLKVAKILPDPLTQFKEKMQIKTTMRYHFTPVRITATQNSTSGIGNTVSEKNILLIVT